MREGGWVGVPSISSPHFYYFPLSLLYSTLQHISPSSSLIFSSIPTRSCAQVNNVLDLLSIFHTACIMPAQVLRSRYIDRKKLTALLNTLYKKSDFSITVRILKSLKIYRANDRIVEIRQLDCQYTCTSHPSQFDHPRPLCLLDSLRQEQIDSCCVSERQTSPEGRDSSDESH